MTLKELNNKCHCFARKTLRKCGKGRHSIPHHGPLSERNQAGRVRICKVTGNRKLCARMASLGVIPGKEAELICPKSGSRCILKIHGGTLSLDQTTSSNIIVQSV